MGEPRHFGSGAARVMGHKLGLSPAFAILTACAAWEAVHGSPAQREQLFRAWSRLQGCTVLACYALQRTCWQRGWLEVGTCRVTASGWAEIEGRDAA